MEIFEKGLAIETPMLVEFPTSEKEEEAIEPMADEEKGEKKQEKS